MWPQDGKIDADELRLLARELGVVMTHEDAINAIRLLDRDSDGELT